MKINTSKTKVQCFNFSKKYSFLPELTIANQQLEVVHETRLLGVIIRDDCRWSSHVKYLVTRAMQAMRFLRRLKNLGASSEVMVDVYKLYIRQGLEISAPLWTGSLTKGECQALEKCLRLATSLILSSSPHLPYQRRLQLPSLDGHRWEDTYRYAMGMFRDKRYAHLFPLKTSLKTRSSEIVETPTSFTRRFRTSSIPTFIQIINNKLNKAKLS